jgi:hypothetical protein
MPRGRPAWHEPIRLAAETIIATEPQTPSVAELRALLERDGHPPRRGAQEIDDKTLAAWIRAVRPSAGDDWSLANASPEDAVYVLPVLGYRESKRFQPLMTIELAKWVAKLGRVVEGTWPVEELNKWASIYVAQANVHQGDTRHVDRALASAIDWQDRLADTVLGDDVPPPPKRSESNQRVA